MDYQKPAIGTLNDTGAQPLGLLVIVETVAVVALAVAFILVLSQIDATP
ncbi:MAG: hypothetical protein LBU36_05925 [Clostridiales bacterium]|jgi:hypothetical protein|nr:hypothetical protein [Clostridiales bacterium]